MDKVARCKIGAGSRTREPGPDLSVPHPPKDDDLGWGRHLSTINYGPQWAGIVIANSL